MSEQEPSFSFEMPNHGEFEATRDNTVLFKHMGRLAIYDHVFFIREESGMGTYLFSHHPNFEHVSEWLIENEYPVHLNLRRVAECDKEAFENALHREATLELESGIPDDWV